MKLNHRWIVASLVAACLPLAACQKMEVAEEEPESPAKVEHLKGEDEPAQITLTDDAVKRLDLQTVAVAEADINGSKQKTIPYAALLYDTEGETWAFANPEPLKYIREKLKVERIDGDKAVLSEGPAVGTLVVTTGAAELYGSEEEFEEE
jgi:hypothetical protein